MAKLEAAGLSLQSDPYASANDASFLQAGFRFEYGHISATSFSDQAAPFLEAVSFLQLFSKGHTQAAKQ